MPRSFSPQIVTASDLLEGDVIYLTAQDQWSRDFHAAEVITDEAHAQLRLLLAQSQPDTVVGAYLANVAPSPTGHSPAHFREDLRAKGPSNYRHGKQEEQDDVSRL